MPGQPSTCLRIQVTLKGVVFAFSAPFYSTDADIELLAVSAYTSTGAGSS